VVFGELSHAQSCLQKRLVSELPLTCGRAHTAFRPAGSRAAGLWSMRARGACGLSAAEGAVAHQQVLVVAEELLVPRRHLLIGGHGLRGGRGGEGEFLPGGLRVLGW
jgi:hypothetical protein